VAIGRFLLFRTHRNQLSGSRFCVRDRIEKAPYHSCSNFISTAAAWHRRPTTRLVGRLGETPAGMKMGRRSALARDSRMASPRRSALTRDSNRLQAGSYGPASEFSGQRRPRRAGGGAGQSRPRAGLFMMKLLGAGPFWTAVAERSGDTAFAPGGAEADGPGSRFARCQSGGAVRRLPDSATAVQSPPGPDPGSGHEPRPRTAPEVSG